MATLKHQALGFAHALARLLGGSRSRLEKPASGDMAALKIRRHSNECPNSPPG